MGLDQKIVRVSPNILNKFYAENLDDIIAPYNPDLDYDYIHRTTKSYEDLRALHNRALEDNETDEAEKYSELINNLQAPYVEPDDIWWGRKKNHIHQWVIDNCDAENIKSTNVDYVLINPEKLLNDVHAVMDNPELAADILPTQSGFFFGGIDYDEYYFDSLDNLYKILSAEKEKGYFDNHSYFYWSWW